MKLPKDFTPPREWQQLFKRFSSRGQKLVLLGAVDSGKTTLARFLITQLQQARKSVALLDTDLGQTTMGPPGTLGLQFWNAQGRKTRLFFYFVGTLSPAGALLSVLVGVSELLKVWENHTTDFLIVDTSGFVEGPTAVQLKRAKLAALAPAWVVALQKSNELEPLLGSISFWSGAKLVRLPVSETVQSRNREARQRYRQKQFSAYFRREEITNLSLQDFVFLGTWLGSGEPIPGEDLVWASQKLEAPVLYGESTPEGIFLLTEGEAFQRAWLRVAHRFDTLNLWVDNFQEWKNRVVGFQRSDRLTAGLGRIVGFDTKHRRLRVASPLKNWHSVRAVQWSTLHFNLDETPLSA